MTLSVIIPVFNEEENLPELLRRTLAACRGITCPFELILVDDGSRDSSPHLLESAAAAEAEVVAVLLNRNYGQHAAVIAGMAQSAGRVVVTLDADLQNPPEEIPRLFAEMAGGVDVVGTVRQHRQDSLFRRAASAFVNRMVQKSTGVMMHDYGCMLRAYRRPIVDAVLQCSERSTFIPILANSFAATTREIEVAHHCREHGDSKYSVLKLVALQFDLLTSMSTFPLRMLSLLGIIISVLGIGFGTLLGILRLCYGPEWGEGGVFTLFAVLFVFIGFQFMGMGLLGEYLGRVYHDVRGRPRYFVEKTLGRGIFPPSDDSREKFSS